LILNCQVDRDTPFFIANAAKQLHQALDEKKGGNAEVKYVSKLPHPSEHRNHITGKVMSNHDIFLQLINYWYFLYM